jgi:hypothetical protein
VWRADPVLGVYRSRGDVVAAVRVIGAESDRVLTRLLEFPADEAAAAVVMAAVMPLVISRCRGHRDRVDGLVGEVGLVLAELWQWGWPATGSTEAKVSRLVNMAWSRLRRAERSSARQLPLVDVTGTQLPAGADDPAEVASMSVAVLELRDALASRRPPRSRARRSRTGAPVNVAAAWNTVLAAGDGHRMGDTESKRVRRAEARLRDWIDPDELTVRSAPLSQMAVVGGA